MLDPDARSDRRRGPESLPADLRGPPADQPTVLEGGVATNGERGEEGVLRVTRRPLLLLPLPPPPLLPILLLLLLLTLLLLLLLTLLLLLLLTRLLFALVKRSMREARVAERDTAGADKRRRRAAFGLGAGEAGKSSASRWRRGEATT